ncbi:hypothetical protein IWQ60_010914 [Tieghemiomyces parasiticus]|uniref:Uncharacterized protein n=1 Tax=Tieghemiomyces parasiticus TaxID=78921 RepID=A0A9W7ZIF7_9FUNG|nr:hypothetical protein IWQ60_010914 [Tieghemiomyces parasiticus]
MGSPVGSSQGSSLNDNQGNFGAQGKTDDTQACYLSKLPNEVIHRALENLVKKSDQDQASLASKRLSDTRPESASRFYIATDANIVELTKAFPYYAAVVMEDVGILVKTLQQGVKLIDDDALTDAMRNDPAFNGGVRELFHDDGGRNMYEVRKSLANEWFPQWVVTTLVTFGKVELLPAFLDVLGRDVDPTLSMSTFQLAYILQHEYGYHPNTEDYCWAGMSIHDRTRIDIPEKFKRSAKAYADQLGFTVAAEAISRQLAEPGTVSRKDMNGRLQPYIKSFHATKDKPLEVLFYPPPPAVLTSLPETV